MSHLKYIFKYPTDQRSQCVCVFYHRILDVFFRTNIYVLYTWQWTHRRSEYKLKIRLLFYFNCQLHNIPTAELDRENLQFQNPCNNHIPINTPIILCIYYAKLLNIHLNNISILYTFWVFLEFICNGSGLRLPLVRWIRRS